MNELAAESQGVRSMDPVEILISLQEVLRSAERNAACGTCGQVSRKSEELAESREDTLVGKVKGRGDRLLSQRQVGVSKAVEDHLGLRNHSGRERVGNVGEVVLVPSGLSRIESLIRTEADSTVRVGALFEDSPNVDLGPVAQV